MGIKIAGRSSRELAVLEHVSRWLGHHEKKYKIELTLFAFLKTYISMLIDLDGYKMRLLVVWQRIFFLFNVSLETKKTLRVYLTKHSSSVFSKSNTRSSKVRLFCLPARPTIGKWKDVYKESQFYFYLFFGVTLYQIQKSIYPTIITSTLFFVLTVDRISL